MKFSLLSLCFYLLWLNSKMIRQSFVNGHYISLDGVSGVHVVQYGASHCWDFYKLAQIVSTCPLTDGHFFLLPSDIGVTYHQQILGISMREEIFDGSHEFLCICLLVKRWGNFECALRAWYIRPIENCCGFLHLPPNASDPELIGNSRPYILNRQLLMVSCLHVISGKRCHLKPWVADLIKAYLCSDDGILVLSTEGETINSTKNGRYTNLICICLP